MSRVLKCLCCVTLCGLLAQSAQALPPPAVTLQGESQITASAIIYADDGSPNSPNGVSTQQDGVTMALGYHFVTYYNQDYKVCLARRPVSGGTWKIITFNSIVPPDGYEDLHDTTNVGISENDGRVHLAYGHHVDNLRYRISTANTATVSDSNFTSSRFSAERNYLNTSQQPLTQVTYPIFITQENSKKLMLFWRGNGSAAQADTFWCHYMDNGNWSLMRKIINGFSGTYVDPTGQFPNEPDRSAYTNDIATFGDQIHMTWCWRETKHSHDPPGSPVTNHDLMFAQSSDWGDTWQNNASPVVTVASNGSPMTLTSPIREYTINYNWELENQNSSFVDGDGNMHAVLQHKESATDGAPLRYWHYRRNGTSFSRKLMGDGSGPFTADNRPKVFIDRNHNTIYVVARVSSKLKIFAAQQTADTGEENWDKWTVVYTSTTDYLNPFNGRIASNGQNLWILAQRTGTGTSRLDLVKLGLDFDGP